MATIVRGSDFHLIVDDEDTVYPDVELKVDVDVVMHIIWPSAPEATPLPDLRERREKDWESRRYRRQGKSRRKR